MAGYHGRSAPRGCLRAELQLLVRLETSGAILFLIGTRFLSPAGLARTPEWSARVPAALTDLPVPNASLRIIPNECG
jgi:hypothetical protein